MKLETNKTDVQVKQMKDGQIAVITKWAGVNNLIGVIIQRYGDGLIKLQMSSGWNEIPTREDCRVRVLVKGETLIIE